MKKKLLLLLVALFSLTLVLAQEKSCEKQNYAISFGIKDNFTLKNFIMEIAVKKIINEKSQLRLFLSPEFKNENIDKSISDTSLTVDLNEKRIDLGIGLDYLWILAENNDIDFYGGSGLIVTYTERKDEYTSSYSFRKRESTINEFKAGIRGIIGVEWRPNKNIGIHSEYVVTAYLTSGETTKSDEQYNSGKITQTLKSNGFLIESNVNFGLSVYF